MPPFRVAIAAFTAVLMASLSAGAQDDAASLADAPRHPKTAPHHHRRHLAHAAARPAAPLAAQAVSSVPPNVTAAPVPDQAVGAPIDNPGQSTSVAPSVFQLHYPPQGDGYVTGSSSQAMDDREAAKATGVEVKVPLPQ